MPVRKSSGSWYSKAARVLARAFLAQHWGSDFALSSRKRWKAAARFGVRRVRRWWSVTAAALETRKLLRRLSAFASSGSAAAGAASRSASRAASSASKVRFGGMGQGIPGEISSNLVESVPCPVCVAEEEYGTRRQ